MGRAASDGRRDSVIRNNSSVTASSSLFFFSNSARRPCGAPIFWTTPGPFCRCMSCGNVTSPVRSQAQAVIRSDRPNSDRKYDCNPGSGSWIARTPAG